MGKSVGALQRESHPGSSALRLLIWRSQGRIPIEYTSAFQVCPFRAMVSTDWSALGQGSLVIAAGPDVHHFSRCPDDKQMALLIQFCHFCGPGAETHLRPKCT